MSAGWVAGSVRARALTSRRLGRPGARTLAASPSLRSALSLLSTTPYGHDVRVDQSLAGAQRAVIGTLLWNLRVLAGWAPRDGVVTLRALLGALEVANVDDHLSQLSGRDVPLPYRLGALATTWPRLARTASPAELRGVLTASPWGDPGGEGARDIDLAMRTCWADRAIAAVPVATPWLAGATALLLAREVAAGRELPDRAAMSAARVVGSAAAAARTQSELVAALPTGARWVLENVTDPAELWQAEAGWWRRVEREGFALARRSNPGQVVLVGAVAMMVADAWRVRAALELAARGGGPLEAFDAVA